MFGGLRKKLSEAVKDLIKKEADKTKDTAEEHAPGADAEKMHAAPEPIPLPNQKEVKSEESKAAAVTATHERNAAHMEEKAARREREEELVRLSLKTKLKGIFSIGIVLNENEIDDFSENIKVSLLQSDVSYDTADAFTENLKSRLRSAKLDSKNLKKELVGEVRSALFDVLNSVRPSIDILDAVGRSGADGPVKILFLGPNGTGKTTTMAKIAHMLKSKGFTCVISASDTFRAAAIEQTEHHANKVGVPVIKSNYGADPASIAFDAISYAKSHKLNAVLIDTAGRQETNKNLIHEMEKMVRVAKPDIILFVGESTAGNQLSEQVKEFAKFMKIDGIILTKLDCDAKGGNAISIAHTTGIPIAYIGTGESYDALVRYTPDFIVNAIMPNN
jgi:fused signal recognition particle receptor